MEDENKDTGRTGGKGPSGVAKRSVVPATGTVRAAAPSVPLHGIAGFHHQEEAGSHVRLAPMELDADDHRANTGTGDQPAPQGGSRFAIPSKSE